MPQKRKETYMKLVSIFIGILLALLLGEATIRLIEPRPDSKGIPLKNSGRIYGYAGNSKGYAGGVEFETNAEGFRTSDFNHNINSNEQTIIVLGDSYAFGYGVHYRDSFPYILQNDLHKEYSSKRIRVYNLGIPGYNTAQELATLIEVGLKLRPKVVLLAYHLNDIERIPENRTKKLLSFKHMLSVARSDFHLLGLVISRVAALVRSLHIKVPSSATDEVEEYTTGGQAWRQNQETLKELAAICSKMNLRLGVIVVPYVVNLTDTHPCISSYQEVVNFCLSQNIPVINAFDYFRGLDAGKLWINPFDGHPNAQGQELIAKAALDLIKNGHLLE